MDLRVKRAKSAGWNSERSQAVYSTNWKAEVLLRKKIECLNSEEKEVICSKAIDQRIVATRFRNKLRSSKKLDEEQGQAKAELIARRQSLHERRTKKQQEIANTQSKRERINYDKNQGPGNPLASQSRKTDCSLDITYREPIAPASVCSWKSFLKSNRSEQLRRPSSAASTGHQLWQKRAASATEKVCRMKSTPVSKWSAAPALCQFVDCPSTGAFYSRNKQKRPISREKFYEIFDRDMFKRYRGQETEKHEELVRLFTTQLHCS